MRSNLLTEDRLQVLFPMPGVQKPAEDQGLLIGAHLSAGMALTALARQRPRGRALFSRFFVAAEAEFMKRLHARPGFLTMKQVKSLGSRVLEVTDAAVLPGEAGRMQIVAKPDRRHLIRRDGPRKADPEKIGPPGSCGSMRRGACPAKGQQQGYTPQKSQYGHPKA
jgi:hypothetical protein